MGVGRVVGFMKEDGEGIRALGCLKIFLRSQVESDKSKSVLLAGTNGKPRDYINEEARNDRSY